MNNYQTNAKKFVKSFSEKIDSILTKENFTFNLNLNGINLLESELSAVKSSTAVGYCLEEFFSEKLVSLFEEEFTRVEGGTQGSSYDLLSEFNGIKVMINFKASLLPIDGNSGIAALNKLEKDYNLEPNKEKLYLISKFKYCIKNNGMIKIEGVDLFYLEQVPLKFITQDKRNWSEVFNSKSGRLQVNKKTIKENLLDISEISYLETQKWINEKCK